jgi:protocatechuate 3,4-dioxygenase beta subunit
VDAGGVYSREQAEDTQAYLRGYQITDSNGAVQFKTIFPGWYSGRTVSIEWCEHIHLPALTKLAE